MLPGAWGHSVTVVEFSHLPAGLAAWQRHSLGIYRVCGPPSKFLYALPAYLAGVRVDYPASYDSDVRQRWEWEIGRIFQKQYGERYHDIYRWTRLVPMLVTILGGCLICEWSTRLYGAWPGVISLCVWCWLPPVLGHGSLVTSDIASAVAIVLAARTFWSFLLKPDWGRAVAAGITLGVAAATKYTLLVLYPCWGVMLVARALSQRSHGGPAQGRMQPALRLAALGIVVLVLSVLLLDALYLFQGFGCRLAQLELGASSFARDVRGLGEHTTTAWLRQIRLPIPLEFLRGLDVQLADTELVQSAYLLGQVRQGGWWYWYVAAALFKIPPAALLLFGLALARLPGLPTGNSERPWGIACLLLPAAEAALTIGVTTGTGSNAAFRYLLPTVAPMCVLAGGACATSSGRKVTVALLAWLAVAAASAVPDHLAWQNELGWAWERYSGRPALVGDSLDWGQDLARLSRWITRHSSAGSTSVCVYGKGDVRPYGPTASAAVPASAWQSSKYLAVSAEMLFRREGEQGVTIWGHDSSLSEDQRRFLSGQSAIERVGSSIWIFKLPGA